MSGFLNRQEHLGQTEPDVAAQAVVSDRHGIELLRGEREQFGVACLLGGAVGSGGDGFGGKTRVHDASSDQAVNNGLRPGRRVDSDPKGGRLPLTVRHS